jgi:hypothetical protein
MIYLYLLFVLLQGLDVYTTYTAINTGVGHEANPLMAKIFQKIGLIPGLLLFKVLICAVVYWAFMDLEGNKIVLGIIDLAYIEILINNFKVIK